MLCANDEFFAPKENLVRAEEPVFIEHKYTERGKWMDGWETRRRRTPGHDWCIVRLGARGRIRGVNIQTRFFRGNFPQSASIDACDAPPHAPPHASAESLANAWAWKPIIAQSSLRGDADNLFAVTSDEPFTHVRLNIFPDGGVARLRVHGRTTPDWNALAADECEVDLAAAQHGGIVLACSDEFFSKPLNMIQPGRSLNMGDGWETKRRRGSGHDWCVLALGCRGAIRRIVVDTSHFKGNYPDRCSLEIADADDDVSAMRADVRWKLMVGESKLRADHVHEFSPLRGIDTATHVRLNIFPDGGVARLRLFGSPRPLQDAR